MSAPRRVLRVLVADDDRDTAESLAALARLWGYDARTAYDGPAALAAAVAFRPEVVLLDLGMPGLTGWEVAARLRAARGFGETLLLAHSGFGDDDDVTESIEAGFDRHLTKPLDTAELERLLAARSRRLAEAGLLGPYLGPSLGTDLSTDTLPADTLLADTLPAG